MPAAGWEWLTGVGALLHLAGRTANALPIIIDDPETLELIRRLTELTGESSEETVIVAMRERRDPCSVVNRVIRRVRPGTTLARPVEAATQL